LVFLRDQLSSPKAGGHGTSFAGAVPELKKMVNQMFS
jgi:hypothetical protein